MSELQSPQYQAYLRRNQRRKRLIWVTRTLLLLLFILSWEISTSLHWVDSMLTGAPSKIIASFQEYVSRGGILYHTWVTTYETVIGFVLSMIIGFILSILLWYSPFLSRVLDPYLVVLNALPKVALGPIFYIWLGDRLSIYGMAVAISVIVTILMLNAGFQELSQNQLKLMESFGAKRWQILRYVLLPASIPDFVATMKVNVGLTLVGVIMGEFLSSKAGLGHLILYGGQIFQMNLVMTSIVLLAILSVILYGIVSFLGNLLLKKYHFH